MDPLSLASSIITFVEAANKIKATLDQVGANRKRVRELSANVVKSIVDIEDLFLMIGNDMDPRNVAKLREHLDTLKNELELVHGRCCRFLERKNTGPLEVTTTTVSQWFRRGDIDAMISRLEKKVDSCYFRCQILLSGSIYSALLLHREEYRNNMECLKMAFSRRRMMENDQQDLPNSAIGASSLSQLDFHYLHRQVQRVIEAYDRVKPDELSVCEDHSRSHLELFILPSLPWGDSFDTIFHTCLKDTFCALEILSSTSNQTSLPNCAQSLLFLGSHLQDLRLNDAAEAVLKMAVSLYSILTAVHPTSQDYQRCLANGLLLLSAVQSSATGHLAVSEQALAAWTRLYDASGHIDDMSSMGSVLRVHCSHLRVNGFLDEALDLSQQSVILAREFCLASARASLSPGSANASSPIACWPASGESDAVFCASRRFSGPTRVAIHHATSLWRLACSWAAIGRVAEARVAGKDALSCLGAILEVDKWWREVRGWDTERWRGKYVTWVSIPRRPSQSGSRACIEDVDEHAPTSFYATRNTRASNSVHIPASFQNCDG